MSVLSKAAVIAQITARHDELTAFRRDIHSYPELAFAEHRTAERVALALEACGIETHRGVGQTGVVGVLRAGSSDRAIALRADMDALPMSEANTFPHRSQHAGCMHACGHDGHTAMLLGAAQYLAASKNFDGTVVFIFQPAEEGEGGAPAMIDDGFFERFPVQQVFGMHNWPDLPPGHFGVTPGPVMASTDRVEIRISGHGGHAAMPSQTIDPVVAGAQLVLALQAIAARETDPLDAVVVSITEFHAGQAYNVIPHQAVLRGTVRALTAQVRDTAEASLKRVAQGIALTHRVSVEVDYMRGYPATINTADEAALCRSAAASLVGDAQVSWGIRPSMGAEDFAHFLLHRPGCYVWIGNGGGSGRGSPCGLHNPRYDFNDEILPLGASYWVRLAEQILAV